MGIFRSLGIATFGAICILAHNSLNCCMLCISPTSERLLFGNRAVRSSNNHYFPGGNQKEWKSIRAKWCCSHLAWDQSLSHCLFPFSLPEAFLCSAHLHHAGNLKDSCVGFFLTIGMEIKQRDLSDGPALMFFIALLRNSIMSLCK